jgi:hypothetical protein
MVKAGFNRRREIKLAKRENRLENKPTLTFKNDDERKLFFTVIKFFNCYIDFGRFIRAIEEVSDEKIAQYKTTLHPISCLCPDFSKSTTLKPVICKHLIFLCIKNIKEQNEPITPAEKIPLPKKDEKFFHL